VWPGQNAICQMVNFIHERRVVVLLCNVRHQATNGRRDGGYLPEYSGPHGVCRVVIADELPAPGSSVRSAWDPLIPRCRQRVSAADRNSLPCGFAATIPDATARRSRTEVVLASIGIYVWVCNGVNRRTQEIGYSHGVWELSRQCAAVRTLRALSRPAF